MAFRPRPPIRAVLAKTAVLFGAVVFAAGSALVYFIPQPDPLNGIPLPDASPTRYVDLSLPTVDPLPSFKPKPSPTKAKPSAKKRKPKVRSSPAPSAAPQPSNPVHSSSPSRVPTVKPTPIPTPKPASSPPVVYSGSLRAQVIALINQKRASMGLSQLASNSGLSDQCQSWANYMANNHTLMHSNMEYGGEIIASGATTAAQVVDLWLNSPPHRDIMLSRYYTSIGSGQVDGYWVVQFT